MIRQRIHLRRFGLSDLLRRLLVSLLGAALLFYGAMVVLAALKLAPGTIEHLSAYRTIDRSLSSITAAQITGRDRVVIAASGLLGVALLGPLAWRALPRPYLARTAIDAVTDSGTGSTEVAARALERVAELAAADGAHVTRASARYGAGAIDVRVRLAGGGGEHLIEQLTDVQRRVRDGLRAHGLPGETAIDVTFGGSDPR